MDVKEKYQHLLELLKKRERLAVAFSSGVDSTFLLYAARQALGENVLALTAQSVFFPENEGEEASSFCRENGIRHRIVPFDVLRTPGVLRNPEDRCYLCKRALFERFLTIARGQGIESVAEGSNLDDLGDYRPGLRAISELGILSPLREAELTKVEIRLLSRQCGLSTWNKPSFACLASRFVYGESLTENKLHMVEEAEKLLRSLGFVQFRVRIHGTMARIEVLPEQFKRMLGKEILQNVTDRLHALGFTYVSMDLDGYRTGSMNLLREDDGGE